MRIATSLLALALATGAAAQEFPEWRRFPGQQQGQTLESRLQRFETPEAAQMFVSRNIKYVEESEKIYHHAPDQFVRLPDILAKGVGNCKEGFVAMAGFLRQQGYEVTGIALNPEHGPGHIVAMYKGKDGKLGTAGISHEDFIPPVYADEGALINALALQHRWTRAKASQVSVDDRLFRPGPPLTLKRKPIGIVDLEKSYGVSFSEEEFDNGTYRRDLLQDGYRIELQKALIIPDAPTGIMRGKITGLRLTYRHDPEGYDIGDGKYRVNHAGPGGISFSSIGERQAEMSFHYSASHTTHGIVTMRFTITGQCREVSLYEGSDVRLKGKLGSLSVNEYTLQELRKGPQKRGDFTFTYDDVQAYCKAGASLLQALQQPQVHEMFLRQNASAKERGVVGNTPY